ncbi:MAG: folylpolyglutamate synthase/dihydrofolate synthase family protein [bacterium]|jgi:dihydrofolate synthase/folylpolyglutamate synthase
MTGLSYQASLDFLFNLEKSGIKLGLDRTLALLAEVGDPHLGFRSIHVAGTNGKGSVACFLNSILHHDGQVSGLFTSPHLVDYRERIRTGGRAITRRDLTRLVGRLAPAIRGTSVSYFEATTVLAFEHFVRKKVETAVVEVGMGGRLDSTNVLRPEVSCITSIGLDHTRYLGRTLSMIAAEKAGIIKPEVPVVCGALPARASETIRRIARSRQSRVYEVGKDARAEVLETGMSGSVIKYAGLGGNRTYAIASPGLHQAANAATALLAVEVLKKGGLAVGETAVRDGLMKAFWPGRLQVLSRRPLIILDAAHNAAGARVLEKALRAMRVKADVTVFGALRDKDYRRMLSTLSEVSAGFVLTRPASNRALPVARLKEAARDLGLKAGSTASVARALEIARDRCGGDGTMLICGSLYMIGEAMENLGYRPERVKVC